MNRVSQDPRHVHVAHQSNNQLSQPPVTVLYTSNGAPIYVANANQSEVNKDFYQNILLFLDIVF